MDRAEARAKVVRYLRTIPHPAGKGRWVIRDDATIDHELFWLFSWTTSRALYPRRRTIPMAGNVPLAVSKADGKVYAWGLLYPLEEFAARLRRGEVAPISE